MKNFIIFLVIAVTVIATPSEIFAQNRRQLKTIENMVASLNEQREIEINRANSRLRDAVPGTEANVIAEITQINERYDKLISEAMNIGQKPAPEEKSKKERDPKRIMPGANLAHQGRSGHFVGNSISVAGGADAYATVVQAEANAYLTEAYANSITSTGVISPTGGGLRIVLSNEDRYSDANIVIRSKTTGQETASFIRRGSKTYINLPPGEYSYMARLGSRQPSNSKNFSLKLNNYYEFDGERVGYYIVIGPR